MITPKASCLSAHRTSSALRPRSRHSRPATSNRGFTLVESAAALVIVGLVAESFIIGQQLIFTARVRNLIAQQNAVELAVSAFQDRYRALPGDYAAASTNLDCGASACVNGNGNGRIEAGQAVTVHEDILAWQHLGAAGLIAGRYEMASPNEAIPTPENTPTNVFGGYLHIGTDTEWGYSGNGVARHNLKTGNLIPVAVLAEVDQKIDDGRPGSGRFQFSTFAGIGPQLQVGGAGACTNIDSPAAAWSVAADASNCGGATLLY